MLPEQPDAFEQEVAEIGGVEHFQPILIGGIELGAPAVREACCLAGRHPVGREPAILPAVEEAREQARRPALLVDVRGFQHLLEEADLIVNVQNGEIGFQPDEFGMPPQDFHADGVEGAEPRHALDGLAEHSSDALLHLARRLVGEGDGENLRGSRPAEAQNMGDAGGEHPGLAGAGTGQHQQGAVERLDRGALLGIEPGQVRRRRGCPRARRNPAGSWLDLGQRVDLGGLVHADFRIGRWGRRKRRPPNLSASRWHSGRPLGRGHVALS